LALAVDGAFWALYALAPFAITEFAWRTFTIEIALKPFALALGAVAAFSGAASTVSYALLDRSAAIGGGTYLIGKAVAVGGTIENALATAACSVAIESSTAATIAYALT